MASIDRNLRSPLFFRLAMASVLCLGTGLISVIAEIAPAGAATATIATAHDTLGNEAGDAPVTAQRPRTPRSLFRALRAWATGGDMSNHTRHRNVQGGASRAAVLGAGDGLITNLSLILGVAGASTDASAVRLAGVAGLLAGAFSMAAGELVSVLAQDESFNANYRSNARSFRSTPMLSDASWPPCTGPKASRPTTPKPWPAFSLAMSRRHSTPTPGLSSEWILRREAPQYSPASRRSSPLPLEPLATDSLAILRGAESGHHFDLLRRSRCCAARRSDRGIHRSRNAQNCAPTADRRNRGGRNHLRRRTHVCGSDELMDDQ
jgi:hypothetical protein